MEAGFRFWGNLVFKKYRANLHKVGCAISLAVIVVSGASIQVEAQKAESVRKVVYKVDPRYPQDLRKNGIGGIVRLSVVITPRGTVERVSPIGGNAALVDAAVLAVKQWKYVPADSSTTTEVQIDFIPRQ